MHNTVLDQELLSEMHTNKGKSLKEITDQNPVLLIFLRHFGCVFCKEGLHDLAELKETIENKGFQIVYVHMSVNDTADKYFSQFNLKGAAHISDLERRYYASFGLTKGSFSQLYGLSTWIKGFSAKSKGYKLELAEHLGDSTQMPGIFVIYQGEIKDRFVHKKASDKPDYQKLINSTINSLSKK